MHHTRILLGACEYLKPIRLVSNYLSILFGLCAPKSPIEPFLLGSIYAMSESLLIPSPFTSDLHVNYYDKTYTFTSSFNPGGTGLWTGNSVLSSHIIIDVSQYSQMQNLQVTCISPAQLQDNVGQSRIIKVDYGVGLSENTWNSIYDGRYQSMTSISLGGSTGVKSINWPSKTLVSSYRFTGSTSQIFVCAISDKDFKFNSQYKELSGATIFVSVRFIP